LVPDSGLTSIERNESEYSGKLAIFSFGNRNKIRFTVVAKDRFSIVQL